MVEKLKLVEELNLGGLTLALCPYNGDFIEFECPSVFNPTRLKKSSLVGL
ncbi:hypothetical protein [Helicobacter pylori]